MARTSLAALHSLRTALPPLGLEGQHHAIVFQRHVGFQKAWWAPRVPLRRA